MPETFDLVFRGGGIKGIAFLGALARLRDGKHTTRRLIGTSAGAIFATGWAAGYTPEEIQQRVSEKRDGKLVFAAFLSVPRRPEPIPELVWKPLAATADASIKRAVRLLPRGNSDRAEGWGARSLALTLGGAICEDFAFREWMSEVLKGKGFDPAITLKDFHTRINVERPQQLTLVASDITAQQVLLLNERTAPKLPVLEAVRMSMGIPFVWKEAVWKETWGTYRGEPMVDHLVVDGGLLSNFPMRYFLDERFLKEEGPIGPLPGPAGRVAGLLLDGSLPVPDLADDAASAHFLESVPVVRLGSRLMDTMLDTWDREALRQFVTEEQEKRYLCRIGTKGFSALDFDLSDERLRALVNSGVCAMTEFLK